MMKRAEEHGILHLMPPHIQRRASSPPSPSTSKRPRAGPGPTSPAQQAHHLPPSTDAHQPLSTDAPLPPPPQRLPRVLPLAQRPINPALSTRPTASLHHPRPAPLSAPIIPLLPLPMHQHPLPPLHGPVPPPTSPAQPAGLFPPPSSSSSSSVPSTNLPLPTMLAHQYLEATVPSLPPLAPSTLTLPHPSLRRSVAPCKSCPEPNGVAS